MILISLIIICKINNFYFFTITIRAFFIYSNVYKRRHLYDQPLPTISYIITTAFTLQLCPVSTFYIYEIFWTDLILLPRARSYLNPLLS